MHKPATLLKSFESFLKLCHAYSNETIRMERFKIDENEVAQRLNRARDVVHTALCDDFNTCQAVDELFELVTFMNKQFQQTLDKSLSHNTSSDTSTDLNRHYGSVMSVANYVESMLSLFGLNFNDMLQTSSTGVRIDLLIESSLAFRNAIRNLALSKDEQVSKELKGLILKYCDKFREDVNKANVEFKVINVLFLKLNLFFLKRKYF